MVTDISVRPCNTCNESGEVMSGFRVASCGACGGAGYRYVDCFLCRDTMLLGGLPCECATIGGDAA